MDWTRRQALKAAAMLAGAGLSRKSVGMRLPAAEKSVQPTWESLRDNFVAPKFLHEQRLGIFIHWGLYAVPAHGNEWYARHMVTDDVAWHTAHYGPPDKFGYKDFIPMFRAGRYDPSAWAKLFREAGAGYVVPVAEHHDGFAMYDSRLTRWCAAKMGPNRDLMGELAQAVRAEGMTFGCSFHRMEHHTFQYPATGVATDEFDPRFADFYGPPQPGEMNDGLATAEFQADWLARCKELVDRYQPELVYFDNGVNHRAYDAVKLQFAAYFYNAARADRRAATIIAKDRAFLAGSVSTFEKMLRMPQWIYPGPWLSDDTIGTNSWGYVDGMQYRSTNAIAIELVELVCRGGGLLLNVSPRADGTIPDEQQTILRDLGAWMKTNGSALNSSRPWRVFGEGPAVPVATPADWKGGSTADKLNYLPGRKLPPATPQDFRFTTTGDGTVHVIGLRRDAATECSIVVKSLPKGKAFVEAVRLCGEPLAFRQDVEGLHVRLPASQSSLPYVLQVSGSLPLGS